MTITLHTFASLKDHFESGTKISLDGFEDAKGLIEHLKGLKPEASTVLSACRIAIHEQIVSYDFKLEDNLEIYLIPPSSGG